MYFIITSSLPHFLPSLGPMSGAGAGAGAGATSLPKIASTGISASNLAYINRSKLIAGSFLKFAHDKGCYNAYDTFDQLPSSIVCSSEFYSQIADYLLNGYTYTKGRDDTEEMLALSTQAKTLRYLINDAKHRFHAQYLDFFKCLDIGARSWLSQLESNVKSENFIRATRTGQKVYEKATPL